MTKAKKKGIIVLAVLFVLLTVIAFAVPFAKTGTFWTAYICGVIAIAIQAYVYYIAFSKGEDVKSKFYGFPIARIGTIYLVAQLILSVLEMALAAFLPVWIPLIINLIMLGAAIIGCIAAETARDEIVRQDAVIKKNVTNMRVMQSLSEALERQCTDEGARDTLKKLAEAFKYSDPVTADETKEIEDQLIEALKDAKKSMADGDFEAVKQKAGRILSDLEERNRLCKLSK